MLVFATCHSLRPLVPQSLDVSEGLNRDIDEFVDELNLRDLQKAESVDHSKSQRNQSIEKHWNQWTEPSEIYWHLRVELGKEA